MWTIDGGTAELGDIRRVRVSPSGAIAVGQEADGYILVYDTNGAPISALGRRGGGPGEFRGSPVFNWIGDSLFAGDANLSVFTRAGELVRTRPWAQAMTLLQVETAYHPFFGGGVLMGIRADGDRILIASVNTATGAAPDEWRLGVGGPQQAVIRVAPDGLVQAIYARGAVFEPDGCRGEFCRRTLAATSPDAEHIAVASLLSENEDSIVYHILAFNAGGATFLNRTVSAPQRPIPGEVWDSLDRERTAERRQPDAVDISGRTGGGGGGVNGTTQSSRVGTYPAFREILLARDGSVWLQRFLDRMWLVMAPDGTITRVVKLDTGVRLQAVAGDTLWAVKPDENDVPSVIRLQLKPDRG